MKLCPTVVFAGHAECSTISVPSQSGVCYDHRRRIDDCRLEEKSRQATRPSQWPIDNPQYAILPIVNRQSSIVNSSERAMEWIPLAKDGPTVAIHAAVRGRPRLDCYQRLLRHLPRDPGRRLGPARQGF